MFSKWEENKKNLKDNKKVRFNDDASEPKNDPSQFRLLLY
jgi:hypothetical protein